MVEYRTSRLINIFQAVSFLIMAIAIIVTVNLQQRKQALVEAEQKTRILLEQNLAIHTYFSKQLKPKIFELSDAYRPDNYFEPAWMSSTYAVREIDNYYKAISRKNYYYKESAINARTPSNEADSYEKTFIDEMKNDRNLSERSLVRTIDGEPYFVLIKRGESMEQTCLRCHTQPAAAPSDLVKRYGPSRSFNRNDGELVSAISIRIPLKDAYAAANDLSLKLSILLASIMGITFLMQFQALNRLLLKPLTMLRAHVMAVIDDETKLGAEISVVSSSEEVNDLTRSFNQLSRNLRSEKDGLIKQVQSRTKELTEKVEELESALARVKKLEGIIPICSYCKKIRDDSESWHQLESYITNHSEALFSHGICPDCFQQHLKEYKRPT